MARYLIKLTPHDKFFFGSEKGFDPDNQKYFVKSTYFPQQTALLGMLRYRLLCQADDTLFKNNRIVSNEKAKLLIGEQSFVSNSLSPQTFGAIKNISPVFLVREVKEKEVEKIYPANREYQYNEESNKWEMCELEFKQNYPLLGGYDPKKELPNLLINQNGKLYQYSDLFVETQQTGIRKNYQGWSDEHAFYLQTYCKFSASIKDEPHTLSFAFYVDVDVMLQNSPNVVLGGERQMFKLSADKTEELYTPQGYSSSQQCDKIVLTSDAHIPSEALRYCNFAVTNLINFKCLKTQVATENYYSRGKNDKLSKTTLLQLYEKGSVFYFVNGADKESFKKQLEEQQNFAKIGYNHFIEINKQK